MPITITSRFDGYRLCGREHPLGAREYPDGYFTAEELERLKAEPLLTVESIADGAGGNPPASRETRAAELAAMDYATLCELAKTYGLPGAGVKRGVVETNILTAEFPEGKE
jgi:hypothetical protein